MSGFGGKCMLGIDLGCRFTKCSKLFDARIIAENMERLLKTQKDTLTLLLKMVLTELVEGWNVGWEDWFGTGKRKF
jgi:activator of 2-hydroxyglutaryl-CoA dehydratase